MRKVDDGTIKFNFMDHYAAYDSSVVHAHYQNHQNIDPLITGYPSTTKKQESAVVQVTIRIFVLFLSPSEYFKRNI